MTTSIKTLLAGREAKDVMVYKLARGVYLSTPMAVSARMQTVPSVRLSITWPRDLGKA